MRVVLYTKGSPWGEWSGGGQVFIHGLAQALAAAGHRVAVVYTYQKEIPSPGPVAYSIHWAPWGRLGWSFISVPRAIAAATREIDAQVVFGLGEEMIIAGRPSREVGGRPAFAMGAHHPSFYPIGLRLDFQRGLLFNHYQIRMRILHAALRRTPLVIVPSRYAAERLTRIVGVDAARVRVIPNGIDDAFFTVRRQPLPPPSPPATAAAAAAGGPAREILFVGRMEPQKGVDLLLDAFARVIPTHPDLVLRLMGAATAFEAEYRALARSLSIESRVRFEGWQPPDAVRAAMARCRLCVLPSRYESFGLAAVEAMAAGVPVVTCPAGALADLVEDGRTGFLAAVDSARDLARAIDAALADPGRAESVGRSARESARRFTWAAVAQLYAQEFDILLGASTRMLAPPACAPTAPSDPGSDGTR